MNYEESIRKRRSENREFLKELGILNTSHQIKDEGSQSFKSKSSFKQKNRSPRVSYLQPTRRSNRIQKLEPVKYDSSIIDEIGNENLVKPQKEKGVKRDNVFGAVPVPVGTVFSTRLEASVAGVHRPPVAGIHGNPLLGCYSLALSGGYEDDVDLGDSFIYTGEGGRDLKGTKANPKNLRTAPQSKDQVLERGNLALSMNAQNKISVRVLRGYKLRSAYAPDEGYRYDGLYDVVDYYTAKGISGFNVYKFRMVRVKDQEPAPWSDVEMDRTEEHLHKEIFSS